MDLFGLFLWGRFTETIANAASAVGDAIDGYNTVKDWIVDTASDVYNTITDGAMPQENVSRIYNKL